MELHEYKPMELLEDDDDSENGEAGEPFMEVQKTKRKKGGREKLSNAKPGPGMTIRCTTTTNSKTKRHPRNKKRCIPQDGCRNQSHVNISNTQPSETPNNILSDRQQRSVSYQATFPWSTICNITLIPFLEIHDFGLACDKCFTANSTPGEYIYTNHDSTTCKFNLLATKQKEADQWSLCVRRTPTSITPIKRYRLCKSVQSMDRELCSRGEIKCTHPHNIVELRLWELEKTNQFNIENFIYYLNFERIMHSFGGRFLFLCRGCYEGPQHMVVTENRNEFCFHNHNWDENRSFVHFNYSHSEIIHINRPNSSRYLIYRLCKHISNCFDAKKKICSYAHSDVELDIWLTEQNVGLKREQMVSWCEQILPPMSTPQEAIRAVANVDTKNENYPYKSDIEKHNSRKHSGPSGTNTPFLAPLMSTSQAVVNKQAISLHTTEGHPFNVKKVCKSCLMSGVEKQHCRKHLVPSGTKTTFLVHPGGYEISEIPKRVPKNLNFTVCRDLKVTGRICHKINCTFAHSNKEIEIWKWLIKNKTNLSQLICEKINNKSTTVNVLMPSDVKSRQSYCEYCGIEFDNVVYLQKHKKKQSHLDVMESDRGHQWNFRQPPWKLASDLALCSSHRKDKTCTYSQTPVAFNYCIHAHSERELHEWKDRRNWRIMKTEMTGNLYSPIGEMLQKLTPGCYVKELISEEHTGVVVKCDKELFVNLTPQKAEYIWTFSIQTKPSVPLQKVYLLFNEDRIQFAINPPNNHPKTQIGDGHLFKVKKKYCVQISFESLNPGYFVQSVIFDFGMTPVIGRKMSVNVDKGLHGVKTVKFPKAEYWTKFNKEIIKDNEIPEDQFTVLLQDKYRQPCYDDCIRAQQDHDIELNPYNYQHKMHKCLFSEEFTRQTIISRLNQKKPVNIQNKIEGDTFLFAQRGRLFVLVELQEDLSEDTEAGRLFLESVQTALISLSMEKSINRVYQTSIVREGHCKNCIYLNVSQEVINGMKLEADTYVEMEIQFQMNRGSFCKMHHAVDCLDSIDIAFPNLTKLNVLNWNEEDVTIRSELLNEDQLKAVKHIIAKKDYAPPLIVYGPFGTGKTETLAQSAIALLKRKSRILICTHTNSAADIYFTKYLDDFLKRNGLQELALRIYQPDRRINTVPLECHSYMLYSEETQSFYWPTRETILQKKIIIATFETAISLTTIDIRGIFTHIFIDEAAQALECQVLMPISLANDKTCIVLTGDHRQMNPKIYCKAARSQKFNRSMLERLHHYYRNAFKHRPQNNENIISIFLNKNYRSQSQLLRFISETFYGGPDNLICCSNILPVTSKDIKPMNFQCVYGHEIQPEDSTSFYNELEADAIVNDVKSIYNNWPIEWGEFKFEDISVVSPYSLQIQLIRKKLRAEKLGGIIVERIYNIQGKQFRILFISTVRTTDLCNLTHVEQCLESQSAELGEYGFLSEPNMLNTALTRAQSCVVAYGEPVSLCTIGECSHIWRKFIKHCDKIHSLFNTPYAEIRFKVKERESSSKGAEIKHLLTQNIYSSEEDTRKTQDETVLRCRNVWESETTLNSRIQAPQVHVPRITSQARGLNQLPKAGFKNPTRPHGTSISKSLQMMLATPFQYGKVQQPSVDLTAGNQDYDDWEDFVIKPDEIIQTLAEKVFGISETETVNPYINRNKAPMRIKYHVKEERGHATLCLSESTLKTKDRRQLLSSGAVSSGDADFTSSDEEWEDGDGKTKHNRRAEFRKLLQNEPDKYKRCVMHITATFQHAKVADIDSKIKTVIITSRSYCGRAFDNDEVAVEIFPEKSDSVSIDSKCFKTFGRVVGILNRALNPRYKVFVCRTNPINTGLMIPLNKNIIPIHNLTLQDKKKGHRNGYVVVYDFEMSGKISFSHQEKIDPVNPMGKLFLVRYLKWSRRCNIPLGIVIRVQNIGDNETNGETIIDIEHHIRRTFCNEINKFVEMYNDYTIPKDIYKQRQDLTHKLCFTIDSPSSQDLDDALSIERLENHTLLIGIHIADVSHFVTKNSCIDTAAKKRGTSYYPIGRDVIHMLPSTFSTSVCSLKPGIDKLTISVLISLNSDGEILNVEFHKTIINSRRRFSYDEAQGILEGPLDENIFSWPLQQLYQVSEIWRKRRIGRASVHVDPQNMKSAHMLVAEMMIMANHHVANKLSISFPTCCPLRIQLPPDEETTEKWKKKHYSAAINSVSLTQMFAKPNGICTCEGNCVCITDYMMENDLEHSGGFPVSMDIWLMLCEAADSGSWQRFQELFVSPENYSHLAVALAELQTFQDRAIYICSQNFQSASFVHHSLNLQKYTHFTSPIRRYFDIVVHRLLSAIIMNESCPYTETELVDITWKCNTAMRNSKTYETELFLLHISLALQQKPLIYYPIIETVTDDIISLVFPTIKYLNSSQRTIKMSLLSPSGRPQENADSTCMKVEWQERIYNTNSTAFTEITEPVELKSAKKTLMIPCNYWTDILSAVISCDKESISSKFEDLRKNIFRYCPVSDWLENLTNEARCHGKLTHFVKYFIKYKSGMHIKVQIAPVMYMGMLTPKIQLIFLSHNMAICLEHRRDPVSCFTNLSYLHASKAQYENIKEYKSLWLPVLAMEAVTDSVRGQEQIFIHNVAIRWESASDDTCILGKFELPLDFCNKRDLNIDNGYVCVRYTGVQIPNLPDIDEAVQAVVHHNEQITFVCHCQVSEVLGNKHRYTDYAKEPLVVTLKLQHCAMPFPAEFLDKQLLYTMEFLPKAASNKRLESAVLYLNTCIGLAKKIALGTELKNNVTCNDIDTLVCQKSFELNEEQIQAIKMALGQPFSLIQGPPGTGKTVTGVQLALLFCERNRKKNTTSQLLYCGPSNKSVDVIAEKLLSIQEGNPRFIRVYSKRIENSEFPRPRDIVPPRKRDMNKMSSNKQIQDRSLHHLIRAPGNSYSEKIKEYDEMFRKDHDDIDDETVDAYDKLILEAKHEELIKGDIILSTCFGCSNLRNDSNIIQVIIDEAAMCMEPETMIPITSFENITNIILIGDHKQLHPIVKEQKAKNLGLQISLFERYSKKSRILEKQYRMHKGIMEFPSMEFYDGKLTCGTKRQTGKVKLNIWPNGRKYPIALYHTEGVEDTLTVNTEDGSEMSKSNDKEANYAVNAAIKLVETYGVKKEDIVILSQYRSQCAVILKLLTEKKFNEITVCTVVSSQGSEWKYVIFSTVRSLPQIMLESRPSKSWIKFNLGFIADEHQVNVAITRAKEGLIIIGNKHLLGCNLVWKRLIEYYTEKGVVVDADSSIFER